MDWPYSFQAIPPSERSQRRLVLDRYGSYAQLLVLVPVVIALVFRIATWASTAAKARYHSYDAIPDSPSLKSRRQGVQGRWAARARQVQWWLGTDVFFLGYHWGQRDQWIFGTLWTSLLLLLCVPETGRDYFHFTKRFGIIAASQFPVQYLLALKYLNPFAFVFRSSHEQLNRWHRVLGRIIYMMLCLHVTFYLNYFIQAGIVSKRLTNSVVLAGVAAFFLLNTLFVTSLSAGRKASYITFFIIHLVVAFALPPILFFHARPARLYMAEALLVFVVDLTTRKVYSVTTRAALEAIPGTELIKLSASLPAKKSNLFREYPGSHVYLNIPESQPLAYNPFTVAAVNDETGDITLVARKLSGPMSSMLAKFAAASPQGGGGDPSKDEERKLSLCIEGPYGAVTHFPSLAGHNFDRVLLVAGGVGATFAVPIYRSIVHDSPNLKVDFVWAVRGAGDATWAVEGAGGKSILDDRNVHIFLTRDIVAPTAEVEAEAASTPRSTRSASRRAPGGEGAGEVELSDMYRDRQRGRYAARHNRKRPDLKKIVDDAFKHGNEDRIAVLVCGPQSMAVELREHVGYWVMKGRSVWWHNETFGW